MSLKLGLRNKIRRSRAGGAVPILLDQSFASGATAAYSLRKLKSSATKAVRVREDSGNTEIDIGFSGTVLDETALSNHCGSANGFVSKWYDQSGNGNDASNSTATEQPKIFDATNGVIQENGKPAVLKETQEQRLENSSLVINQPTSYTIVAQSDSSKDSGVIFDGLVSRQHVFGFLQGNPPSFFAGTIKKHSLSTPAGQNLVGVVFDSANGNSLFTINKATINKDPGSNRLEHLIIFDNFLPDRKGNMKIQEFIAFDGNNDTNTILQEQNKFYQSPNF